MKIILASSSPHRKKLLSQLGISFQVFPSHLDESKFKKRAQDPQELVTKLALAKAEKVRKKLPFKKNFLIIAADSIAGLKTDQGWLFLDKPKTNQEAKKMAVVLKGKKHHFYTGLALKKQGKKTRTAVVVSIVWFKNFTDKTLNKFIKSGIWKGRAGGYDIQDNKSQLIEKYQGSYTNILGLPLEKLTFLLKDLGVKI